MFYPTLRTAAAWLRRSLCAVALAAPAFVVGCAAEADEMSEEEAAALSGREFEAGEILRVTANRLNIRARAGTSNRIVVVADRDDLVSVVTTSGQNGWVNIRTEEGQEGWAARAYLIEADARDDESEEATPRDGATCDPRRAEGIVNRYQKALHDTIAHAEGTTERSSKGGYDLIFTYATFTNCARHPNITKCDNGLCSTAAGRYQFLNRTWRSIANARGYATFEPENQERGAAYLIGSVRRATIPADRALTLDQFQNVMSKLSYEWASLPPGRYGQPKKSMTELWRVYNEALGQ